MVLQLLGTSCWYCDNCITKLWALSSYFLYLYMVFIQHCFHLEQHCFHLDRQFSCSPNISNWLSWFVTQSSLVIQNSCSSWRSCTLSVSLYLLIVGPDRRGVKLDLACARSIAQLDFAWRCVQVKSCWDYSRMHALGIAISVRVPMCSSWFLLEVVSTKGMYGI